MYGLYQKAGEIMIDPAETEEGRAPGHMLLELLTVLREWLSCTPAAEVPEGGKSVYLFFRETAFVAEELGKEFGGFLAGINEIWPLALYGTASDGETVCLRVQREGKRVCFTQESSSGQGAEVLEGFCMQIDCSDEGQAALLGAFLREMNWECGVSAGSWKSLSFLREQQLLLEESGGSYYCYGGVEGEQQEERCLQALDFSRKVRLWLCFLGEGGQPLEFSWLFSAMSEGELQGRAEWELALWQAMEHLEYRVLAREKTFELYDGSGQRRYFNLDGRREAEWVLMKLLFPLNR